MASNEKIEAPVVGPQQELMPEHPRIVQLQKIFGPEAIGQQGKVPRKLSIFDDDETVDD